MSHRAIVAIQTGPDEYALHYSHNGAHELWLTEPLEEHIAGHTIDLDAVAETDVTPVPQSEQWTAAAATGELNPERTDVSHNLDAQALNPEPMYQELALDQIGYPIDFANIEAVYVVRDGGVETYVPLWMEPDMIRPWRDHLTVEVYRADQLPRDPTERLRARDSTDPCRVIDDATFAEPGWRDDTTTDEVVTYYHEAIYSLHRAMGTQDATDRATTATDTDDQTSESHLATETYDLSLQGPPTKEIVPSPTGRGLLVRVPSDDLDAYWDVVHTASQIRVEFGSLLNGQETVTEADLRAAQTELAKALLMKYQTRIAPASPDPYGSIVKRLTNTEDPPE